MEWRKSMATNHNSPTSNFFLSSKNILLFMIWPAHFRPKDFGPTVLEGLIITDHSLTRSHYWSTRKLLAAGFPLWPGASLLRQPGLLGLPQEDHVDAYLSADANSTCTRCNQNSPPHIVPISDLLDAGLQELAKLPASSHQRKTYIIQHTYMYTKKKASSKSRSGAVYCFYSRKDRRRKMRISLQDIQVHAH